MTPQELKLSILSQAFQGKLVSQLSEEGAGADLLPVIQAECHKRITSGQIKKFKTLPAIDDVDVDFDVPDTWHLIRLGSICQLLDGEKRAGEAYPYLEARYLRGKTEPTILTEGKYVVTGTNVILVDGENSGEVFRLTESGYMGSTFKVLFVPEAMLLEYVIYFLQYHKTTLRNNKKGAAIPHLNKDIFFNLILPLPPLAEQKRIVAKIEELLPLIDRYEQAWGKLEEFNKCFPVDVQKSILQMAIQGKLVPQLSEEGTGEELFQQIQTEKQALIKAGKIKKEKPLPEITEDEIPFDIPDSWKWTKLGRLFVIERGSSPRPIQSYLTSSPDGVNWIKIGDSEVGAKYITSTSEKITTEGAKKSRLVSVGDFIISNSMSYGRPYIMAINGYVHDGWNIIHNIQIDECDVFDKDYLYYVLSSNLLKEQMKAKAAGGVVKNIKSDYLRDLIIPVPPLAEQKRIVAKLEEILPLCERLK